MRSHRAPRLHGTLALALATILAATFAGSLAAQCNSVPIAVADTAEYFGQEMSVDPTWNDREVDGEALTLSLSSHTCANPPAGPPIVVSVENGTLRFSPTQPGRSTTCAVTYEIEDEHGFTAQAQVTLQETALFRDGFETGATNRWFSTVVGLNGGER